MWSEVTELITLNKSFAEVSEFLARPISPFYFSTDFPAFFPLARKGKSAEYDRETESARKRAVLWPGLQESPLQEGRFACSVSPVQDLAAAGAAHASRTHRHSNAEPWVTSPANADIHLQPQQLQAQPVTCSIQLEGHDA